MEEGDDGSLKLCSSCPSDRVRAERLPDDAFADVGSNEEGDPRTQAVALLEKLVQADDDDARKEQLHKDGAHRSKRAHTSLLRHATKRDVLHGLQSLLLLLQGGIMMTSVAELLKRR